MSEDIRRLLSERSCALMGYPEPWDSAAVAVIVAQRSRFGIEDEINKSSNEVSIDHQQATVVTWNPAIATKTLNNSTFNKNNIAVVGYNSISELYNLNDSFIVFDSIQEACAMSYQISPEETKTSLMIIQDLLRKRNAIIILFTSGVTNYHFEEARKYIKGAYFFWATFLEVPYHMQFNLHESNMTPKQEIAYSLARKEELSYYNKDISFENSQKICNILLPADIRELLDTRDEPTVDSIIKLYTKTKPRLRRNTEEDKMFDVNEFLVDSPKIKDLIAQLHLYPDMKHVIYTRYENHYGVKMLYQMLTAIKFKCSSINKDMDQSQQLKVIEDFNKGETSSILILSNHLPKVEGLYNISHIHFLDSGYDYYHVLMDIIFRFRLYTTFMCNLFVHNYVCQKGGSNSSADTILYEMFVAYQNDILESWERTQKRGYPIVLGKNGYLAAMNYKK